MIPAGINKEAVFVEKYMKGAHRLNFVAVIFVYLM